MMLINPFWGALVISGSPVLAATDGSPYTGFTATASGGTAPYTYSLVGTWPTGISINSSTGAVSGTPTESGSFAGISVRVTDNASATADLASFTLTVADDPLVTEYLNATEFTHDWANLTGWTTTGVQVSSNRLYGISGGNPTGTGKAFAAAATDIVKVTAEIELVGTSTSAIYVGLNFGGSNDGVNSSLPNFAGVGIANRQAYRYCGANFTGVTTGSSSLGSPTARTGNWRAIVVADADNISLTVRKQDGSEEYGVSIPRSAAPNSGAVTSIIVWNNCTGTSSHYVKAIGVKKSLTPFRTKTNAAGTIDGNTGIALYRNVSDLWRIHLPTGLDGETRAPVCIYFPQVGGVASSPVSESRAVNVDQALESGGYIVLSASDNGDQWGNQQSLDNFSDLLDWVRARVYCGPVVLLGVSGGAVTAWNGILRGDIGAVAIAGICPVCDLDNMEANASFTASVRAAYGAANHAAYVTNSAGFNPLASANLASFTGKGVKFYCSASGDTTVPNASHVDVFEPLEDDYAAASTVDLSGTTHLDTEQFQGTDLVAFFDTYV